MKLEIGSGSDGTTLTPVAEYVYQLDDWNKFAALGATDAEKPSSLRISEMTALGHDHFLVDERTDQVAKLFEISLEGAHRHFGSKWDDEATSPSLEQTDDLASAGITPVSKTERLVASSLENAATRYPGKIEGVSLTADGKLIMINDNDFGIAGARDGDLDRRGHGDRPAVDQQASAACLRHLSPCGERVWVRGAKRRAKRRDRRPQPLPTRGRGARCGFPTPSRTRAAWR